MEYVIKKQKLSKLNITQLNKIYEKGIFGNKVYLELCYGIHVSLIIVSLATLIRNDSNYKEFRKFILSNLI